MGGIDLDPASCEFANRTVKATRFFSKEDNGLMHPWFGRIWLNPPYGKTLQGGGSNLETFTRYLVNQHLIGNVSQAVLLIPVNTATSWFPILWEHPTCFPGFRIRFQTEQGPSDGAAFGTCFVYFGVNEQRFTDVFGKFGRVVRAIDSAAPQPIAHELWEVSA